MPGFNPPFGEALQQDLGRTRWLARAIAQQQNYTCSDSQGRPVLNMGLIPGSNPAAYGLQVLNPATGVVVGEFVFNTSTGVIAQQYFTADGVLASQIDANGTHYYDGSGNEVVRLDATGLHVYNSSGTEEVRGGLLNASPAIYGLAVLPYGGSELQQVGGALTAGPGSLSTSSTAPTAISGTTVTVEVGPSGEALVTLCGSVEMNGAAGGGGYAYMGVSVDSGTATNWVNNQTNLASAQITESLSASRIVTGLTPGTHTFEAAGWIGSSGVTGGVYGNVYVTVQPL